jgi:hypothetical protein
MYAFPYIAYHIGPPAAKIFLCAEAIQYRSLDRQLWV